MMGNLKFQVYCTVQTANLMMLAIILVLFFTLLQWCCGDLEELYTLAVPLASAGVANFEFPIELVGTNEFLGLVLEFCETHDFMDAKKIAHMAESLAFENSQQMLSEMGLTSRHDFSFLVGDGNTELDFLETLRVYVGKYSYGWKTAKIYWWGRFKEWNAGLKIGRFVQIAENAQFFLGGGHCYKRATMFPFDHVDLGFHISDDTLSKISERAGCRYSRGPITIGNDVWIGADVTIMSGVTVGDGAIIGAGSVVRDDVPPYSIVLGNPNRVISFRHGEDQIQKLQAIKWWDWTDEAIAANLNLLLDLDVDNFINAHWVPDMAPLEQL